MAEDRKGKVWVEFERKYILKDEKRYVAGGRVVAKCPTLDSCHLRSLFNYFLKKAFKILYKLKHSFEKIQGGVAKYLQHTMHIVSIVNLALRKVTCARNVYHFLLK